MLFAGGLFWVSYVAERHLIRQSTQIAFEGGRRVRGRAVKTPLARLHPMYTKWLQQTGSKRTAKAFEMNQWKLVGIVFLASYIPYHHLAQSIVLSCIAFAFPLIQIRNKMEKIRREIGSQILLVIFLLRIYVQGGCHNLRAVRLLKAQLDGKMQSIFSDAESLMDQGLTFGEVMNLLADETPSEDLELIADELRRSAKHQTDLSQSLNEILRQLNDQQDLNLLKEHGRQKFSVYGKLFLFFISPIIFLVMCYVWQMISGVSHVF